MIIDAFFMSVSKAHFEYAGICTRVYHKYINSMVRQADTDINMALGRAGQALTLCFGKAGSQKYEHSSLFQIPSSKHDAKEYSNMKCHALSKGYLLQW